MMRISTKGRYALRIMLDLAEHEQDDPVALRLVANRQHITLKYMEIITSLLIKENLITSVRGKAGGYRLARRPEEYTVYEILKTAEGDMMPTPCTTTGSAPCLLQETCLSQAVWQGLGNVIREYLSSITLRDILSKSAELQFCSGI